MRKTTILPALLLIMAMFAVAEFSGQKEIIFPEISALALGAWVMEKPPWKGSALDIWLSPTLAALTGMLMVRYFAYAPLFMIGSAFCLVVFQLTLLRSGVLPSISAAVLAIITRTDSWYYPLSVCVLTGIIALGRYILERSGSRKDHAGPSSMTVPAVIKGNETLSGLAQWSKLLAGVMVVSAVAAGTDHLFMVAPPLIVAFVELSKPGGALKDKSGIILGLLVFAALSGLFWFALIHIFMHWPLWVSAAVSSLTVFCAYHVLQLPFPPAMAIALLPTILPQESFWSYPWQVLFGSAAFIAIAKVCFAQGEQITVMEGASTE